MKVKYLAQEHNKMSKVRARTRTPPSGEKVGDTRRLRYKSRILVSLKGPLKYLLLPLLGKNQLAITLHMYASTGPNLDNTHRGQI